MQAGASESITDAGRYEDSTSTVVRQPAPRSIGFGKASVQNKCINGYRL